MLAYMTIPDAHTANYIRGRLDSHLGHSDFMPGFSHVERLIKVRAKVALEFPSVDCCSRGQDSSSMLRADCLVASLVRIPLRVKTTLSRFGHGFSLSVPSWSVPT